MGASYRPVLSHDPLISDMRPVAATDGTLSLSAYEPEITRERPSANRHGGQLFAQEARNAAPGRDRQSNAGTHEAEHGGKLGDGHDVI